MKWVSPAGAWAIPNGPRSAVSFGGKLGIDDDTETPNTLTAGFNYGDRELVFEVRGNLTGGEGTRQGRVITAGPRSRARWTRTSGRGSAGGASGCPGSDAQWDRPAIRSTSRSAICSTVPKAGRR